MSIFKTALRLIIRYPVYILLYIVLWSFLGLVLVGATASEAPRTDGFEISSRPFAVIDRDHSEVSASIATCLSRRSQPIELVDQTQAIQDAIAQNSVCYILIIPEGYGAAFLAAARADQPAPQLQSIYSIEVSSSVYLNNEVSSYLNALRVSAAIDTKATDNVLIQRALDIAAMSAPMAIVEASRSFDPNSLFPIYCKYSAYPMTSGISILVAMVFSGFRQGGLRRRNLSAPLSVSAINLQVSLAGLCIVGATLVFINLVSLLPIVGGIRVWAEDPASAALIVLATLVYALLPLAIGFLLSLFSLSETATNGFINIIALTLVFLSGIMMGGSSYLDGSMLVIARFMPTYWYSEAIEAVAAVGRYGSVTATDGLMGYYLTCLGLMMLFNLAVFSVALLVSRLRAQTSGAESQAAA